MKKLYGRLAIIFFLSTISICILFVTSLFGRMKKEYYHYLEQLLMGVEGNIENTCDDYDEKIALLEEDYTNRAWAVEYILSDAYPNITERELSIIKNLMEVQGISVTDSNGTISLSVGKQNKTANADKSFDNTGVHIEIEKTKINQKPSFFYVEVQSQTPAFSSVRLDVNTERLGLMSRTELIQKTLEKATTEDITTLAVVEKEEGNLVGISKNNKQRFKIDGVGSGKKLLQFLNKEKKEGLKLLKINGEYQLTVIEEQDDWYLLAVTQVDRIAKNAIKTISHGIAGIALVSCLTIMVIHVHLKKYLFYQIKNMRRQIQNLLAGDYSLSSHKKTISFMPELQPLVDTIDRLQNEYIDKQKGITKMEDALSLARTEARFDRLTGLYNRNGFEYCIKQFMRQEYPSGVLILFDLDNFKKINDSEGHPEGDRILVRFADCLRETFRNSDFLGRLGGDEFIVLMPNYAKEELLDEKFTTFLRKVQTTFEKYYNKYQFSVSIGAVPIEREKISYDCLYRYADTALYIAKYLGKGGYYINKNKIACMRKVCIGCRKNCPRSTILQKKDNEKPFHKKDHF